MHLSLELSLNPRSKFYQLDRSQKMLWKTYLLHACSSERPHTMQYAVLENIIFQQTTKKDIRLDISQTLHTLKFNIKLHVSLGFV